VINNPRFLLRKISMLAGIGVPLASLDLYIKHLVRTNIADDATIWLYSDIIYLTLSKNYNKILAVVNDPYGVFYVVSGVMFFLILGIYLFYRGNFIHDLASIFALSGGFGNILDKVLRGYGTDYIGVVLGAKAIIFNLADVYIIICILLFLIGIALRVGHDD
jgi:lipoprotein signal peptidase